MTEDARSAAAVPLLASVGSALAAWTSVEEELSRLFCVMHGYGPLDHFNPLSAAYRAIVAVVGRIEMAGATVAYDERLAPYQAHWTRLQSRMIAANRERNQLAHFGVIEDLDAAEDDPEAYSIQPYYTFQRLALDKGRPLLKEPAIRAMGDRFSELAAEMHHHVHAVHALLGPPSLSQEQLDERIAAYPPPGGRLQVRFARTPTAQRLTSEG